MNIKISTKRYVKKIQDKIEREGWFPPKNDAERTRRFVVSRYPLLTIKAAERAGKLPKNRGGLGYTSRY